MSKNSQFESMVNKGLVDGGVHVNASKGHGKTRLLFSIAENLRKRKDCRTIIFDGSDAWFYGFSKIPVFEVAEDDIQILTKNKKTIDIERYALKNWEAVKFTLSHHKDLLFRIKTRKPSKRGFFVRQVTNYIDRLQRAEREKSPNNEPKQTYAFFIEEAQDAFNSRSTIRLEAEEFLTVFNEARNQKEAFFTSSQRLTDFSKTIRAKQHYCIGNISIEDKATGIRAIEKANKIDFAKMPQRNWFFEGQTFESPIWNANGKPYFLKSTPRAVEVAKEVKAVTKIQNKPIRQPNSLKQFVFGFMGLFIFILCVFFGYAGIALSLLLIFGLTLVSITCGKVSFPAQTPQFHYVMEAENCPYEREEQAKIEFPEECYPDSLDSDLLEWEL